jgi:hypothetical protein
MATDHGQHMDVNGRQELGWLVPRVLQPDSRTQATNWQDSKVNTHRIDWQTPDGTPYRLEGEGVNNGEAYVAKLKRRQIIAPDKVPSGGHVYWSQAGNDFGCPPTKGHNLDIDLRGLANVPADTPVTLTFQSAFEIEWDYDYGFVMATTDGGRTYRSFASENGTTTPASQNPNGSGCQAQYGNGITGASGSYGEGTAPLDRALGAYPDYPFIEDEFDLSSLAGQAAVLRFAYATDTGTAKAGWFIDDIKVTVGDKVFYASDFEDAAETAVYNGGCREALQTAAQCTPGWQYVAAVDGDPADHAYYLELRDRSSFDLDGKGEDSRANGPTFQPGLSLVYTDENHGYGNAGTGDPPAQTPVDSVPQPEEADPNLDDAAFKGTAERARFSDAGDGHVDNYTDPRREDGLFRLDFGCLTFQVSRMAGDTDGPATAPGDLNADAALDAGGGCAAFDFGLQRGSNQVSVPGVSSGRAEARREAQACIARSGYRRAKLRRRGRGLRVDVRPQAGQRFRVDVFRVTRGKRVIPLRRVARFRSRTRAFTWRAQRARNGVYAVRVRATRAGAAADERRFTVVRRSGRFSVRRSYDVSTQCGMIRLFGATRPAFGGRTRRALRVRYRVDRRARVALALVKGRRVVRRFAARDRAANRTYSLRVRPRRLPRGELRLVLLARAGDRTARRTVAVRRL